MRKAPFAKEAQLASSFRTTVKDASGETRSCLAGQPRVECDDEDELVSYVVADLLTPWLNQLAPHLWLVAKQDSRHISSLTHQIVKGRRLVLTEDPGLHLVWINDRVFIKPLPKYLLCFDFWEDWLLGDKSKIADPARDEVARAAKGFVRSYALLIRHKSDFRIAQSLDNPSCRLLPKKLTYATFCRFISAFNDILDDEVSPRWNFGELRLTRLNFWTKIILHKFTFFKVNSQYGELLARFYGPLAFIFAFLSVSLGAMQVGLAVEALNPAYNYAAFVQASWGFSIFALILVGLSVLLLFATVSAFGFRETIYALRDKIGKYRAKKAASNTP